MALIERYYALDNQIRTDQSIPVSRYNTVTTGEQYSILHDSVRASRLRGERATGGVKVVGEPDITRLSPAASPTSASAVVCIDVREARLFDRDGHSLVAKSRRPFYIENLTIAKKAAGWRVSKVTNRGTETC